VDMRAGKVTFRRQGVKASRSAAGGNAAGEPPAQPEEKEERPKEAEKVPT